MTDPADTTDPFDLERFVRAQDPAWPDVLAELRACRKRTHWMWFVFPQLRGLGRSEMATRYGIGGLAEARAYLAHPVLGPRLRECAQLMLAAGMRSMRADARFILGEIDAVKLCSSMTLFELAAAQAVAAGLPDGATEAVLFRDVLDRFFGRRDQATLTLLRSA